MPLQSRTNKHAKRPSATFKRVVDACIESAVNDDTATATDTFPCVAVKSTPAAAINSTMSTPLLLSTQDAGTATLPHF